MGMWEPSLPCVRGTQTSLTADTRGRDKEVRTRCPVILFSEEAMALGAWGLRLAEPHPEVEVISVLMNERNGPGTSLFMTGTCILHVCSSSRGPPSCSGSEAPLWLPPALSV